MLRTRVRVLRPFTVALLVAVIAGGGAFFRHGPAPAASAAPAAATIEIAIRGFAFDPNTPSIAPGTTVRWTNYDAVKHTVTGIGAYAGVFKSALLGQGESFEYTFTAPGGYTYSCSPHPYMQAQVEVPLMSTETGFATRGCLLSYWATHGLDFGDPGYSYRESLALFGLPIAAEQTESIDGKDYRVQYFERARLEYHPDATDPQFQVLLGQFGRALHPADPAVAAQPGATFFDQTGHNLGGRFLDYWTRNGGLAIFGLPLTEPFQETLGGKPYTVQYFERARFEAHPENAAPYDVLLGHFGRQILDQRAKRWQQ